MIRATTGELSNFVNSDARVVKVSESFFHIDSNHVLDLLATLGDDADARVAHASNPSIRRVRARMASAAPKKISVRRG